MQKLRYVKDHLDEKLDDAELTLITDKFVEHLVETNIDPRELDVDEGLVDAIIDRIARDHPKWRKLPEIERIWKTQTIQHVRGHLRNQRRGGCKPLLEKIDAYKETTDQPKSSTKKDTMAITPDEFIQI